MNPSTVSSDRERHIDPDYRIESGSYSEPPTREAIQTQRERQIVALKTLRERIFAPDWSEGRWETARRVQ